MRRPRVVILFLMTCVAVIISATACSSSEPIQAQAADVSQYVRGGNGEPYTCSDGTPGSITFTKGAHQRARWVNSLLTVEFIGQKVTLTVADGDPIKIQAAIVGDEYRNRAPIALGDHGWTLSLGDTATLDARKLFAGTEGITAESLQKLTGEEVAEVTFCT